MSSLKSHTAGLVRGEMLRKPASGLTARLAMDEQTKADAYSIRHASYLSGGYIDPRPDGLFSDADDLRPNNRSVVIYRHGRPVASVRMSVYDRTPGLAGFDEIPASRIFPAEVLALADSVTSGRPAKLTEINRLVRHPDFATDYELVFVLYRFVGFFVAEEQADMTLSCVRRNHTPFYKRLHFEYVAGPRRYAGVKFETNLMSCPNSSYGNVLKDIPVVDAGSGAYSGLLRGETVPVFAD
ncbi:N-acyl amino acid synthase FeeM domain-containing protein [Acidocella sp.]|uniref:N-acyl amino acid synthase FeeM domain-containing protein n=1 Tax=Acidocella sp. TaxID=50710 RepID=UPI003D0526EF